MTNNSAYLLKLINRIVDNPDEMDTASVERMDEETVAQLKNISNKLKSKYIHRGLVDKVVTDVNSQVLEFAQNNYYCTISHTDDDDILDSLIVSMNMLGEEINHSTVSRIYFTDIYNTIPDYVLVVKSDGIITNANKTFLEAFDMPERSLVEKTKICDFIENECDYRALIEAVNRGDNKRNLCVNKGQSIPVTIKVAKFTESKDGEDLKVFIIRDITEIQQYQDDLERALLKAQESDRLKSAFLANMSHEIRTPMNGILGFADLLNLPNLSEEKKTKFVDVIKQSGKRMLSTVDDIIDISKIQAGQENVEFVDFNVVDAVNELYEFFSQEAETKGLYLTENLSVERSDAEIHTDKTKLVSIITNLIKNAIKFTDQGQVKISIERINGQLVCCIKDTGIGIPKDRQEAIFERFVQADVEDIRAFQGSGLGLAIAKSYVEMLGGEINVDSKEGLGSTFTFSIPWANKSGVKIEENNDTLSLGKKLKWKVLIAEDDMVNYEYLFQLLEDKVDTILWAKTGVEAVNFVKTQTDINLVLMDIKMPEMNGYEATRKIKEISPNLPIVAQTAYALIDDKDKALAAGCDFYLSKPININKLLEILSQI